MPFLLTSWGGPCFRRPGRANSLLLPELFFFNLLGSTLCCPEVQEPCVFRKVGGVLSKQDHPSYPWSLKTVPLTRVPHPAVRPHR